MARQVTANYKCRNLKEHYNSFLCFYNQAGFLSKDEEEKTVPINYSLLELVCTFLNNKETSLEHMDIFSNEIYRIVNKDYYSKKISIHQIKESVAKIIGYKSVFDIIIEHELNDDNGNVLKRKKFVNKRYISPNGNVKLTK